MGLTMTNFWLKHVALLKNKKDCVCNVNREISLLNACHKLYTKIFNEKFQAQTERFLF